MIDQSIKEYTTQFRKAIEETRDLGGFSSDYSFCNFPKGCCGDTSYLLAEYLKEHDIQTIWVSTERGDWTHAWLVVKDHRIKDPTPQTNTFQKQLFCIPEEIRILFKKYGEEEFSPQNTVTRYTALDIDGGLIVDITSDQFNDWDIPVYVGYLDQFHRSFSFIQAHDYDGLKDFNGRLRRLYRQIYPKLSK